MNLGMLGWQLTAANLFNNADDTTKAAAMAMMGGNLNPTANDRAALTMMLANGQNGDNSSGTPTVSDAQEATKTAAANEQASAATSEQNALNSGLSKSQAGMLGEVASSDTTTDTAGIAQNYANNKVATQNDYLSRMGQLQNLQNQFKNATNSAKFNVLSGTLSGAAQGASTGLALSDENMKEPVNSFNHRLNVAIAKYKAICKARGEA